MIDKNKISKILVVGLSNVGDSIITIPVLSVLRAEFPDARIDLITGRVSIGLFQGSADLGKFFAYDKKWGWLQKWVWVKEIAKEKYDLAVDLRHTLIPVLIGAKYRTRLIRLKSSENVSARDKHLNLLVQLGLNIQNLRPIRLFGDAEKQKLAQKLAQKGFRAGDAYVVIAPGANSSTKQWPLENFESIARFSSAELNKKVVFAGSPAEKDMAQAVDVWAKTSGIPVFNLIGETSLRELAALVGGAHAVVANDSAVMQLASELNVPTTAIFGPTNEKKYAKQNSRTEVIRLNLECAPCESAQCRIERRKCLDDLTPELVKQAILKLTGNSVYEQTH